MLPPLYIISDSSLCKDITHTLKQCLDNGAPWIGIREYAMHEDDVCRLTENILTYALNTGAMVSIWQNPEIAEKFSIGCHMNMSTYTPDIKSRLDWDCPLGISTHTQQDLAHVRGCDYATLSPVFDSISKQGYMGMGLDAFAEICSYACMPVFALGGITSENAPLVFEHGAYGVAVCADAMQNPANIQKILQNI